MQIHIQIEGLTQLMDIKFYNLEQHLQDLQKYMALQ